ncbi:reverse transcriptase domain-containing protein [Tanacetum coccineum]
MKKMRTMVGDGVRKTCDAVRIAKRRCQEISDGVMTSNNVTFIASFIPLIMEYFVKISKKARILELKRRHLKITVLTSYTPLVLALSDRHPTYHETPSDQEVTTRGGKTTTQRILNDNTDIHDEGPSVFIHDKLDAPKEVLVEDKPQKAKEQVIQPSIEALAQMPKYAKFLKSLLTNKASLEEACTITMNERCSAVLLNILPSKEKYPGSFTIPCNIGHSHINNALADLGASISLMPYTMYEKLGLREPKPTRVSLELADRSI